MADNKKYYYLKLKENFFESDEVVIIESMPDGYLYSNILLKLYLRSLKNEGKLIFNDRIPFNPTMLSRVTRHNVGTIEKALNIFKDLGLVEILDNGAIYMMDIQNFIGQSSTEGDRKRQYRKKIEKEKNMLMGQMSGQTSDKYPPEIEIEIEKEIELEKDKPLSVSTDTSDSKNNYEFTNAGIPSGRQVVYQMDTQDRLGKDRLDNDKNKETALQCNTHVTKCNAEKEMKKPLSVSTDTKASKIDYDFVKNEFNRICISLPKVRTLTEKRKKAIKARYIDLGNDLNGFTELFQKVNESDFLSGKSGKWSCNFDWVLKSSNFVKVMEDTYKNKGGFNNQETKSHLPKFGEKGV